MTAAHFKELSAHFYPETIQIRRHLHQFPELSFNEKETAAYISSVLSSYGIPHQKNVAGYGIIGLIQGKKPDDYCVALRSEMDALPIKEEHTTDYSSSNQGISHACGHDAHTSMLLTAARILQESRYHFTGTVKLIFQPAEEKLPGGARSMIEAGCLQNPRVDAIIAQHVLPQLPKGAVGFRPGAFMASGDEINITIKGKGGHAALPNLINDNVLIASQVLVNLQQIVSRLAPPEIPTVLSFGRFIASGAHNVIPNEVILQGTFRTFNEQWRSEAKNHITRIATHTALAGNAQAEVFIEDGYPALINHENLTLSCQSIAAKFLGKERVVALDQRMTTEDFAWFTQQIPSCFYRIGTGKPNLQLHAPDFDIDEEVLNDGAALLAWIAFSVLKNNA